MSVRRLILLLAALASTSPSLSRAETATVSGVSQIYLRSGPGTTYSPNGVVNAGESVTTLDLVGNWQRVETSDGRSGFVYTGYLTFGGAPAQPTTDATAVAPAESLASASPVAPATSMQAIAPPSPTVDPAEVETWQAELSGLKAEVARLRSEVGRGPEDETPAAALTLPTRGPVEISPSSAEASNLRTVGVAVFFLIVGWVFGAGFARRRTRSQRGRLRF